MQNKINALKVWARSIWGKDKETLSNAHKYISRPIESYAAPVYAPQLADSGWKLIQRIRNS